MRLVFIVTYLVVTSSSVISLARADSVKCSDSEYRVFLEYDAYIEAEPDTPVELLRKRFSKKIKMKPEELRWLHTRCVFRQADEGASNHAAKVKASENRKSLIESQFSSWDGAHINLEKSIKAQMHDPSSYKHVETRYQDKGNYIIVSTKFRGKNLYGAVVMNTVRAKVGNNGEILQILEQF